MGEVDYKSSSRDLVTKTTLIYIGLVLISIVAAVLAQFVEPLYIIVAIIGVAVACLIYYYVYFGLILYLLLFLLRPAETYTVLAPLRLEFLLGGALIVIVLMKNKWQFGTLRIPNSPLNSRGILLLGALFLSLLGSACTDCTIGVITMMSKLGVFYLLIILTIDTRLKLIVFFMFFVSANIYMAGQILNEFASGVFQDYSGLARTAGGNSAIDNFNGIAITMNSIIPFIYYLMLHYETRWKKIAMALMLAVSIITLVLTGSRGGLLGFLTLIGIFWYRSQQKLVTGAALAFILIVGWFSIEDNRRDRYMSILSSQEQRDESAQGRLDAWVDGLFLFAEKPLTGVGAGAFAWARVTKFGVYLQPHSMYVQILAELGIIGAVLYGLFLAGIFRINNRILSTIQTRGSPDSMLVALALSITASCYSLMVTGIFAHSGYRFSWFVFGALTVVGHRLFQESQEEQAQLNAAPVVSDMEEMTPAEDSP